MTVDIDSSLKVCNAYLCRKKKQKQNKNAKMFKLMIFKNIINNFEFCLFFKQSPAFKFSRKASSSYSLRLESGRQKDHQRSLSGKRRTNSTPASPSHATSNAAAGHHHHHHHHGASSGPASAAGSAGGTGREPQCTCMTPEQYARLRAQDPRFRGIHFLFVFIFAFFFFCFWKNIFKSHLNVFKIK